MDETEQGGYKVPPKTQDLNEFKIELPKKANGYFDPQQVHVYSTPKKKAITREPARRGLVALSLSVVSSLLSLVLVALLEQFYGFLLTVNPELSLSVIAFILLSVSIICLATSAALAITAIHKRKGRYFGIAALAINAANILAATPAILLLTQMLSLL
jgi:hypothetical protein